MLQTFKLIFEAIREFLANDGIRKSADNIAKLKVDIQDLSHEIETSGTGLSKLFKLTVLNARLNRSTKQKIKNSKALNNMSNQQLKIISQTQKQTFKKIRNEKTFAKEFAKSYLNNLFNVSSKFHIENEFQENKCGIVVQHACFAEIAREEVRKFKQVDARGNRLYYSKNEDYHDLIKTINDIENYLLYYTTSKLELCENLPNFLGNVNQAERDFISTVIPVLIKAYNTYIDMMGKPEVMNTQRLKDFESDVIKLANDIHEHIVPDWDLEMFEMKDLDSRIEYLNNIITVPFEPEHDVLYSNKTFNHYLVDFTPEDPRYDPLQDKDILFPEVLVEETDESQYKVIDGTLML